MTRRGTFGDMFGAANALFSALAFACVFYAMLLQRRDLRLQRDEMDQNQRLAVIAAKLQGQATMAGTLFETIRLSKAGGGGGEIEKELREQLKHRLEQIDRLLADLDQEQDEERAKPSV